MLDEIDEAFDLARADEAVRVVIVRGAGGVFSTGHDLGTPEGMAYREALGAKPGIQTYDQFKKYNLDLLLKWRNFPKPTIAMVEGYCIYAGWMLAAAMDVVFAAEDAEFLGGFVEYNSIPWDIGVRRAKELCFESRFITAAEAAQLRPGQPRAAHGRPGARDLRLGPPRGREQPRGPAHGQDADEQGPGRPGLQPSGGGQPGRLLRHDVDARRRHAHGGREPAAGRRPRGARQARARGRPPPARAPLRSPR